MHHCQPEIIVEGTHFNIARCTCCQRIGLYYKNLLLGFHAPDFKAFTRSFNALDFEKMAVPFPDGRKHVVINTCHYDIQFTFNKGEFEEMKSMLQEAVILLYYLK